MFFQASLVLLVLRACGTAATCDKVYAQGLNDADRRAVIDIHNKYRKQVANGEVKGQPRAINMMRMSYDDKLAKEAEAVSAQCEMEHNMLGDDRFPYNWVGQNLFISWSSEKDTAQNWTDAVTAWFNEHNFFTYPTTSAPGKATGHYTQLVWSYSNRLGCDFILYYDKGQPQFPYAKLYSCNYGPGGNWEGEPPYLTGNSGCENLC